MNQPPQPKKPDDKTAIQPLLEWVEANKKQANDKTARLFSAGFGAFLGLSLLKFGNPCIFENLVDRPADSLQWLLSAWPAQVGYELLAGFVIAGLFLFRIGNRPRTALLFLPLLWLAWQFVAARHSVDAALTVATLKHFSACVACFFIGFLVLPRVRPGFFLAGLLAGLAVVIVTGWQQRFGGLEETRRYFYAYLYPQMHTVPAELLQKVSSNRIFSTLFYPNALAGVLLLLLPVSLALVWGQAGWLTTGARKLLAGLLALGALACLYWSQSKGGWLLMLLLGLIALRRAPWPQRTKVMLVAAILAMGLAGFTLRFAGYFEKGATSAVARGDYWRAAVQTSLAHPLYGTGPGTFAIAYKQIKKPGAEMARLVHNDYLQQASDSGLIGGAAYLGFITASLWFGWRRLAPQGDWLRFSAWLGLLGWCLQSLLEFGLYIPALAWPGLALMGWLLGSANGIDNAPAARYTATRS